MILLRSTHNHIVAGLADRCDALQADLNWWANRCIERNRESLQLRETIAEQASVIEELRARLQRFERVRGRRGGLWEGDVTIHLYVQGKRGPVRIDCTEDTLPVYLRGVVVLAICAAPTVRVASASGRAA